MPISYSHSRRQQEARDSPVSEWGASNRAKSINELTCIAHTSGKRHLTLVRGHLHRAQRVAASASVGTVHLEGGNGGLQNGESIVEIAKRHQNTRFFGRNIGKFFEIWKLTLMSHTGINTNTAR